MSVYTNPHDEGSDEYLAWVQGAGAALTAVQVVGELGGEYITNIVMEAEDLLGLVDDGTEEES